MRKRRFRTFTAALGAALLFCGCGEESKPENKLFTETIFRVDTGGLLLNYRDCESEPFDFIGVSRKLVELNFESGDRNRQAVLAGIEVIESSLRILNPGAIRAWAFSCRRENDADSGEPVFLSRMFLNTGDDPEGLLYDLWGRKNRDFTFTGSIPASALVAVDLHLEPGNIWRLAKKAMLTSGNPILGGVPGSVETACSVAFGIQLPDLLDSLDGEYLFLVLEGTKTLPVRFLVSVPDNSGLLATLLRERSGSVGWSATADGWKMPESSDLPHLAPEIVLQTNRVLLISDRSALSELESGERLVDSGKFRFCRKALPDEGRAVFWLRIDLKELAAVTGSKELEALGESFGPWICCGGFRCADDGYAMTLRSNFIPDGMQQKMTQGAILAGMLLPSLNNARAKARQIQCMSQLRQLGVYLELYADEHDGKYPASLSELPEGADDCLTCPGQGEKPGYFYLPATAERGSSEIPLLLDRNGVHLQGFNILFCDGHVEMIRAGSPVELLDELNRRCHYSPELLRKLRQALLSEESAAAAVEGSIISKEEL